MDDEKAKVWTDIQALLRYAMPVVEKFTETDEFQEDLRKAIEIGHWLLGKE